MGDVILLVVIALCSAVLGAYAQAWWHVCPLPMPAPAIVPPVLVPPPPAPVTPLPTTHVRFVSGSGRLLGDTTIRGRRAQSYRYRAEGLMGVFVASQAEDGVWIYRRVGVERE